ncbi:YfhO family protein [Butyrivibrio sp. TB]|uniref:YfhO family protein n=1 Tax=Butyrivibrio sp. TB TaxID=1520809 RepID=UPI0015A54BD6|nr:YfhO family protein [Butyrivibrio sp. TB]
MKNKKELLMYLKYSVVFIIVALVVFSPCILRRSSLVAAGDCYNQFFPSLNYLSHYYRSLLGGNASLYDTSIGFGDDVIGTLSYYGLGDIFLIPSMFFSNYQMAYVYSFIVLLKMWFAGAFFIAYCRYKNCSDEVLVAAGISYGISFYMLQNGLSAYGFLTAPVWFPLIMLGIDKIYDGKNKAGLILLSIVVFVQSLNGFYFLYYDIVACVCYCLIRTYGLSKSSKAYKDIFIDDLKIAGGFLVGVVCSLFVLLPVLKHYFQSPRTQESDSIIENLIQLPSMQDIVIRFRNLIIPSYSLYEYGFGLPVTFVLVSIWIILRIRKKTYRKYAFAFCIIGFGYFFPFVGTLMNGFSYNTSRWMYIAFFIMTYTTAKFLPEMAKDIGRKEIIIGMIIFIVSLVSHFLTGTGERSQVIVRIIIFTIIVAVTILLCFKRNLKVYSTIIIVGTAIMGFMFFAPMKIGGEGVSNSFKTYSEIRSDFFGSVIYELSTDDSYSANNLEYCRVDYNDSSLDAPCFMGINSTYSYYSICNGSILDLFVNLRVSPAFNGSFEINGLDNRQVLESLFSTKVYSKSYYDKEVLTNEYYLPQGLFFDKAISVSDAEALDYLDRMNVLMEAVIVDNAPASAVKTETDDLFLGTQEEWSFEVISCNGAEISDGKIYAEKGATITYEFDPISLESPYEELYMQIDNLRSDTTLWSDIVLAERKIRTRPISAETYLQGNYDYLINISSVAVDGQVTFSFDQGGEFTFDEMKLVVNRLEDFDSLYQTRSEHTLNVTYRDNDSIEGTIDENSDGYLMINLPYSQNWKCYCDGQEIEVVKADYSFMAVYLPAGEHVISFKYEY